MIGMRMLNGYTIIYIVMSYELQEDVKQIIIF